MQYKSKKIRQTQRGFGMIELMVGIVVGLLSVLAIMKTSAIFQAQKSNTVAGVNAQEVGMSALMMMDRSIQAAGYGYEAPVMNGCDLMSSVMIKDGDNNTTDMLWFSQNSDELGAAASELAADLAQNTNVFYISRNPNTANDTSELSLGFQENTQVVIVDNVTNECSAPRTISVPGVKVTDGSSLDGFFRLTLDSAPTIKQGTGFLTHKFPIGSWAYSLGNGGIQSRYCLDGNRLLLETLSGSTVNLISQDCGVAATNKTVTEVVSNVVDLQLQYGISVANGNEIVDWVDATGVWAHDKVNMDSVKVQRIRAIRAVIVAVNAKRTSGEITSPCTAPVNSDGPCAWADSATDKPPLIKLKGKVGTGDDWKHYRYNIYHAVIPVRNQIGVAP